MANFCVNCGSPLSSGPFCVKCGADTRNIASSAQPQSPVPAAQTPQAAPVPGVSASPKQGMSPLAKLAIAAVVIIFVGGALGAVSLYYAVHRVSQKIHEAKNEILGSSPDASNGSDSARYGATRSDTGSGTMGNVCRFLSKEDVSKAIGVQIIRTDPGDGTCSYIAKGNQADMTARHVSAMMAARGADQQQQQMVQNIAGGMFKSFAEENHHPEQYSSGEIPVFMFSVNQNAAEEQMRLNSTGLSIFPSTQNLSGIGDQAFVAGDGMIMVRKGKNLIQIMYLTCPCGTEAVTPLAKKLAARL